MFFLWICMSDCEMLFFYLPSIIWKHRIWLQKKPTIWSLTLKYHYCYLTMSMFSETNRTHICKHRIWLQKNLTIWSLKICILQYIGWIQNCWAYIFVRKLRPWVVLTVISHWAKFGYFYFVTSPPVLLYSHWST